jgi:hypothetical protein
MGSSQVLARICIDCPEKIIDLLYVRCPHQIWRGCHGVVPRRAQTTAWLSNARSPPPATTDLRFRARQMLEDA